jgi:hypothetical protein
MDGGTPIPLRARLMEDFNTNPDIPLFLLTTKVGGWRWAPRRPPPGRGPSSALTDGTSRVFPAGGCPGQAGLTRGML